MPVSIKSTSLRKRDEHIKCRRFWCCVAEEVKDKYRDEVQMYFSRLYDRVSVTSLQMFIWGTNYIFIHNEPMSL
jgi:hypothetical protein